MITGLLCAITCNAQQVIEKNISFSGKKSVELDIQIADSIIVRTWDRNEVYIKASVNINDNMDNDAYLTSFKETGDNVVVNAEIRENYFRKFGNQCNETDICWEVIIPDNVFFSIETINACITITGETTGMEVRTISGFIDLSLPSDQPADISFSTVSGTIYSNHDLKPEGIGDGVPTVIRESLSKGGPEVRLGTISGDIFFRKAV